jgi:hypothetical protein
MDRAIRWRIISLQAILFVVLGAASGFAFIQGTFVTNQVHDELVAQQIFFPGADQVKAGGALDPAEFPAEIRDQAGNQVTDGSQARIYANDFIGKHLQGVAGGKTYSQVSSAAIALQAQINNTPKTDPNYAAMQTQLAAMNGQKATLFQGETLRSMLLNSYGWWTVGTYTTFAAYGIALAALVVLGAVVFEVYIAYRKPETVKVTQKKAAPTPA